MMNCRLYCLIFIATFFKLSLCFISDSRVVNFNSFSKSKSNAICDPMRSRCSNLNMRNGEDEEATSTVDWDAELKRLNSNQVKGVSGAEVAVEKFKKQVDAKLNQTLPIRISVPSPKKIGKELLTKDWRFWVAVIAALAFASSLIVAINREELVVLDETYHGVMSRTFDLSQGKGKYEPKIGKRIGGIEVEFFRFKPSLLGNIETADLVISHAGAGSIMEVLSMGKPLIVVANSLLMNNHQIELSEALSSRGFVLSATPSSLHDALDEERINALVPYSKPSYANVFLTVLDDEFLNILS